MRPDRDEYKQALAHAALLFAGWMSRFEGPTCEEQDVVVRGTLEWMEKNEHLMEHEDIGKN